MNVWLTELSAIDTRTGLLTVFAGQRVESPTIELAQNWCKENAPYLEVICMTTTQ